jgi:hypothetical protein
MLLGQLGDDRGVRRVDRLEDLVVGDRSPMSRVFQPDRPM